ncbi:hypothetical protein MCAV_02610 [[Mycoplasma] cavipharyngis]
MYIYNFNKNQSKNDLLLFLNQTELIENQIFSFYKKINLTNDFDKIIYLIKI